MGFWGWAGGDNGAMATMGVVNRLWLDFRCRIVRCYVYATEDGFTPAGELSEGVRRRVDPGGLEQCPGRPRPARQGRRGGP